MKNLKTIALSLIIVLGFFSLATYSACVDPCMDVICENGGSCNNGKCACPQGYEGAYCETISDPCKNIFCLNDGKCIDGKCNCAPGFEGVNCETSTVEKFLGTWTVFENGTISNPRQYEVSIQKDVAKDRVKVFNFANMFSAPIIIRINHDSLFIPEQMVEQHEVGGWGILEPGDNSIILRYRIINPEGQMDDFGKNTGQASIWSK